MMKKFALAVVVVIALGALVLFQHAQIPASPPTASPTSVPPQTPPAGYTPPLLPPITAVNSAPPPPVVTTPPPVAAQFKNGSYTGDVTDAYYGLVQVRADIQGGRLISIAILQQPNDRRNSIEINNYAMPILVQEAIQAQSAQVDIVSGATASSEAFTQSLDSALAQARN